jgi:hypothetical protein
MKKILLSILGMGLVITAFAQKTINDPNVQKRDASGFHAIEIGGGIDLYLSQGDEAVAVSASETKFRDRIRTEVVNGVLKISYEYDRGIHINISGSKMKLKAYVSCKQIDAITGSGGSDVDIDGTLKAAKLSIELSGGSDFEGRVEASELKTEASGGSDFHISGSAKTLSIEASGGSDFKGYDLVVETCTIEASGGSDIYITANKELIIENSGGSDIHYKGSAVITNVRNSGGGSVRKSS